MQTRAVGSMLLVWSACLTTPAFAAAIEDYQIVSETGSDDSLAAKAVEVECPVGTSLLSGGSRIFSNTRGKSIVATKPLIDAGAAIGWQSVEQEMISAATTWSLRSYAVCGNVPGLEVVTETSGLSSVGKFVEAMCPNGKSAIGGGAELDGSTDSVSIYRSLPLLSEVAEESVGWSVAGVETFPTDGLWSVTAYAVCAELDVLVAVAESGSTDDDLRELSVYCPGRMVALGGGVGVYGIIEDFVTESYPLSDGSGWSSRIQRPVGEVSYSSMRGMVVCPEPDRILLAATVLSSLCGVARAQRGRARRAPSCIAAKGQRHDRFLRLRATITAASRRC